jgi:hypothetical protein
LKWVLISQWFFNGNPGGKTLEKVVSGAPGSQHIQQFIRFLNPGTHRHTNPALKQVIAAAKIGSRV